MRLPVIGVGLVSGMGTGVEQNISNFREGHSALAPVTLFETNHDVPVGEVRLSNQQLASMLGVSDDKVYSRTALLGMLAASQALSDAGIDPNGNHRIGLISATSVGGMDLSEQFYKEYMADHSKGRLRFIKSHDCADSTLRIAEYCNIKGFTSTISTACSSAANAIMLAARMLEKGMLDYVVAGGTDALCKFTLNGFHSLMILDNEQCRPFDESRSGLNLGEGAAYIVLAREGLKAAHKPYCQLSGFSNANDAYHQTATSVNGEGAYRSMSGALEMASISAGDISYVNVHGTGTPNNDASEGAAMLRVFGDNVPAFSSTKAFTGHTLAAAGGIEAVLSVLALSRGLVYPNRNFKTPIDENLVPQTIFRDDISLKHVMSNSFGFGGNSSTLIFSR